MRRLVIDLLWFSVPTVAVERKFDLTALRTARAATLDRPTWTALFAKGFAQVSDEMPFLRRAYVKLPWPHLYEYPESVAMIMIGRVVDGEHGVFALRMRHLSRRSVADISREIRAATILPLEEIKDFKRQLFISRLIKPVRRLVWWLGLNIGRQRANFFGSFGLTIISSLGTASVFAISPLTTVIAYGVIPDDGVVTLRVMFDHRVYDGVPLALALNRLEEVLNGNVLQELQSMPQVSPHANPTS